jgi:uracil-DNA glycosylase family 4
MSSYKKVELPDNPPQPNLEGEHPEITSTGIYDGISYVAGKGRKSADCMFLMPSLFEEDARDGVIGSYGKILKDDPCFMKSQAGASLIDLVNSFGISRQKIYSTAIVKWLLPKERRTKPSSQELAFGAKFFEKELKEIQPKLVICLGKQAFDFFCPYTLKADDVIAGVLWSEKYNCYYTLQHPIQSLQARPFMIEEYKVGLKEAISLLQESQGITKVKVQKNYRTIHNSVELMDLVMFLKQNQYNLISVDCEWSGLNPWMGQLRSIQFAWAPGQGVYVRFMDDQKNYVFDVDYKIAGDILRLHLDDPKVKFVGHHFAADSVWMEHTLGINTYEKCYLDTEFACQCINEHNPLGLEYVSMKYTDLGRYDMELLLWRKTHPQKPEDGFGLIPDELLIPYAIADVDAVIRAVPFIVKELEEQGLTDYYFNYFNKFVTDVFTHFTNTGLKMCTKTLEDLRILYGFCKGKLEKKFVECVAKEAEEILQETLSPLGMPIEEALKFAEENLELTSQGLQIEKERLTAIIQHYHHRDEFNFRSGDDMKRWLFEVKGFEPFKSTPQKDKGRPSISWEKVKTMPPELQKLYKPSADKQTLSIYENRCPLVKRLVGLNLVGNIYKMCLKPASLDDEGNVVRENGIFFFIDPEGYIRPNYSSTETG